MSDVAISYKSELRTDAGVVADKMRAAGLSVWMDESAETAERTADAYGIIPGQQWTETIEEALLDAGLVLILDSPAWRRSAICRWEYDYARYCGKRISVIPIEVGDAETDGDGAPEPTWPVADLDDLVARYDEHADVVRAHTRVLRAATGLPVHQRLVRFLIGSSDVSDVKAVQDAAPDVTGLRLNDFLRYYAEGVLVRAARRRRRLAATAALIVVVLVAASVIAFQHQKSAEDNRQAAEQAARIQRSLLLASQAIAADDTVEARQLLGDAAAAADTPALRAARAQVEAAAYQRTTTWIPANSPADPYIAVALSDDGRSQAVASRNTVIVFDTYTGERLKEFSVPAGVRPAMLQMTLSGDLLVGTRDQPGLISIADDGVVATVTPQPISQFTVDDRGDVWIVDGTGVITRDGRDAGLLLRPGERATGIAVDRGGQAVNVLYANGFTERFEIRDGTLQSTEYTYLFSRDTGDTTADSGGTTAADNAAEMTESPPDDIAFRNRMFAQYYNNTEMLDLQDAQVGVPYPVQMIRCGSALLAYQDAWLAWQPFPGAPGTAATPRVVFRSTRSMACFGDAGLVQQMAAPAVSRFPGETPGPLSLFQNRDGSGPTLLASNRSGDHLSVLHPDGRLELSETSHLATRRDIPKAYAIVPLAGRVFTVGPAGETFLDGKLVPADRAVSTAVRQRNPALTKDRAAITAEQSAVVLDSGGVAARHTSPGHAVDLVRTSQRGTFVASTGYGYFEFEPTSDSATHSNIPIEGLNDDEAITDVDVGKDIAVAATDYGRLVVVDETGHVLRDVAATAPSADYSLALSRDGETIIALGSNGMLTEFDAGTLDRLRSVSVGSAARTVRFSQNGDVLVVATADNRVLLVDPNSLETLQVVDDSAPLSLSYVLDSAGSTVLGLSGEDPGTAMDRVPVYRSK